MKSLFDQEESNTPTELEFRPGNIKAIKNTCDVVGQVSEAWGFKRVLGAVWTLLYLSPQAACAKDICKALGISPALVSITLQDLLKQGVVSKKANMNSRRDYFVSRQNLWGMVEKLSVKKTPKAGKWKLKGIEDALNALNKESDMSPDLKSRRTCQFQKVRIEEIANALSTAGSRPSTLQTLDPRRYLWNVAVPH